MRRRALAWAGAAITMVAATVVRRRIVRSSRVIGMINCSVIKLNTGGDISR